MYFNKKNVGLYITQTYTDAYKGRSRKREMMFRGLDDPRLIFAHEIRRLVATELLFGTSTSIQRCLPVGS